LKDLEEDAEDGVAVVAVVGADVVDFTDLIDFMDQALDMVAVFTITGLITLGIIPGLCLMDYVKKVVVI
jgi:hypothetical protein